MPNRLDTDSLVIVATITAEAGQETAVEATLKALIPPTRAESGCLSYHLHVVKDDPQHFVMIENWRDTATFDQHLATAHFQAASAALEGKTTRDIQRLTPVD